MDVDIGADAIFHALGAQFVLRLLDLVARSTVDDSILVSCCTAYTVILEIGLRRAAAFRVRPRADQLAQVLDHPVEPGPPLVGGGAARRAGDAVQAGAVDRMGEDQPAVRSGSSASASRSGRTISRRDRQHQRGLRVVGVPIRRRRRNGIRARAGSASAELNSATIRSSMLGAQHFERAAQRRGIGDMGIDDEQPPHAGVIGPVADLLDELDERRPAAARSCPASAGYGRASSHRAASAASARCVRAATAAHRSVGQHRIHAAAHDAGRAARSRRPAGWRRSRRGARSCGQFGPGALGPQHG